MTMVVYISAIQAFKDIKTQFVVVLNIFDGKTVK